ncbi:MAG: antibiotic biosynthesis monooxygenase [Bacteroidales bacterium]
MKKSIANSLLLSGLFCMFFVACTTSPRSSSVPSASKDGLVIVATVTIHDGYKDELLNAFRDVIAATRQEEGCISYNVYEDVSNPSTLTFIEYWASQSAIDRHNQTAHLQGFVKALEGKAHLSATVMKHKL